MLAFDDDIRQLIQARTTASQIKDAAMKAGMRTLRDDGIGKILAGVTTTSEVERVTVESRMWDKRRWMKGPSLPSPTPLRALMVSSDARKFRSQRSEVGSQKSEVRQADTWTSDI